MLVVRMQAHHGPPNLVVREQLGGATGVLGRNQVDLAQRPERPERHILEVPDWGGDDEEGAGHGGQGIIYNCRLFS